MTSPSRRKPTRAGTSRAGTAGGPSIDVAVDDLIAEAPRAITVDDAQLVEEAELGPAPRARVAVLETAAEHAAAARATIEALGHGLVASGAGAAAAQRIVRALRDDDPPDVVVVPVPGGEAVIDAARALAPRRPVIVAAIAGPAATAPARAHAAGADLAARRPHDAEHLGPVLMAAAALAAERARVLTLQGTEAMLRARLARGGDVTPTPGLHGLEPFRRMLEVELKRARRYGYALSVLQLGMIGAVTPPPPAVAHELRVRAAAAITGAIRDIDFPTEIADDRFLVLLPYTDVGGAEQVARRVVAAVRAAPPVRAGGAAWSPAVAAGVAGVAAGQPVRMAQLMRDAGEALRAARRRHADVVVQP